MIKLILDYTKIAMLTWVLSPVIFAGIFFLSVQAHALTLKTDSTVSGSTITLADVFDGAPEDKAAKVLGLAPQPGEQLVIPSRTLLRVAMALGLPWRPSAPEDSVTVTRSASIITPDMIRASIKKAVDEAAAQKNMDGHYDFTVKTAIDKIVLPPESAADIMVTDVVLKPENNSFAVTLVAPAQGKPLKTVHVNGVLQRLTSVPVLKETLQAGALIGARDLEIVDIADAGLPRDAILRQEDLIGMTPRRMVAAGKPVRTGEIESPRMVTRGDTVTMIFQGGGLQLTTQGKALEHGAKGDQVHVVNASSNKTIAGIVTANREVTIENF